MEINKPMRIGIDARFMLRPLRGIPLYVLRLCQHLPSLRRDYQFIYFINKGFEHNDKSENYQPRIDDIEKDNPNVTFVNYDHDAEIMWEQVYLPRLVKQHYVDLLHMPGNRVCFFPGVPTVVTVHDVIEILCLLDQKYPLSWAKNRSIRLLLYNLRSRLYVFFNYHFGIPKSSRVITVSNSSAADIIKTLTIATSNVAVIHHGVDNDYLEGTPLTFEQRSFILLLGGDSYQKNPEAAISSWASVTPSLRNRYPLKIVGFCGKTSSSLIQTLRSYGLEGEAEIHGWVSQMDMVSYFKNAALFLFPSRAEGFGFPLLQAMACGTPVISTNKTSIPEVLGPVGLKYDPDDYSSMAQGIEKILLNREEWERQSDMGYQRSKQFTWENSAMKHITIYEELV